MSSKNGKLKIGNDEIQITRLIARHLRERDQAKALYKSADAKLDKALALGVAIGEPIEIRMRDKKNVVKRKVAVTDVMSKTNVVFRAKSFHRYEVADYKEPKVGSKKAEEAAK